MPEMRWPVVLESRRSIRFGMRCIGNTRTCDMPEYGGRSKRGESHGTRGVIGFSGTAHSSYTTGISEPRGGL